MDFKGAIFDLDGVVVDTVPVHFRAWEKMFSEYGRKFTFDDYKNRVDGIPRIAGARAILTDVSEKILKQACEKKQRYFRENIKKEKIKIYKSTIHLIKELKLKRIKVAVASSSQNTPHILKSINLYNIFEAHIFGGQIKKGKPDPEIFIKAAKKLKLFPEDCVVFEDAKLGVEAAKNGNMICVGIDRHNNPKLLKEADIIVKDLTDINYNRLKNLFVKKGVEY